MARTPSSRQASDLACDVCGRLPHPRRARLTVAKLAAVFPVELLAHAVVLSLEMAYLLKVALLTLTATVLVIWVLEPSAMRLLGAWLHAPALRDRRQLDAAPALWRVRATVDDEPGVLEHLAHAFAELGANILTVHVHPDARGSLDEFVVSAPAHLDGDDVAAAVEAAGGRDVHAWTTTPLALADGQTKALSLASRVVADPSELPLAVADLLGARIVTEALAAGDSRVPTSADGTLLKVPSPWSGAFMFSRPGEPFTPAERARASRLAELAERACVQIDRWAGRAYLTTSSPVPLEGD